MKPGGRARKKPTWLTRTVRCSGLAALAVAVGIGGYLAELQLTGNFHTVVAGELYRSAQPSAAQIAEYAKMDGIRSVFNLRGASPQSPWYRAEIAESRKLRIGHIDFPMSAHRELSPAETRKLIAIMAAAPKPLLIHCKAGADRSGLAAALYLAAIAKSGEAAAEAQISLFYGHISLPISGSYAMDRSFERSEPLLGFKRS